MAHATLPALDADDVVATGKDTELDGVLDTELESAVNILLPDLDGEVRLGLGEDEGIDTTVKVGVAGSLGVAGDHDDGADRAVLAESTGGVAGGGQDKDSTGVELNGGRDSSHGNGVNGVDGARGQVTELVEDRDVRDGDLSEETGLVHHADGVLGVLALSGLTRKHDAVSTVENSVGNVRNLSTSGAGVVGHGLEHLSGADDGLASDVALGDHHLLGNEDLGGGDLNTEITTGNHDTVGLLENLIEVVDTLLVLNLGNDLDLLAVLTEDLTDVLDILTTADERGEDHVDAVLDTEAEISDILLGQGGKIDISAGEVDTLLGGNEARVEGADLQGLVINDLNDLEGEDTIINVDELAGGNDLGDVLVVNVPADSVLAFWILFRRSQSL